MISPKYINIIARKKLIRIALGLENHLGLLYMQQIERYRGSLLGLAVGDALGTTLEFCGPGTFAPINDMVGGGPFRLQPGEWTDDTSMALCLAESLIEKQGFDPVHQLETYLRWSTDGHLSSTGECFDIGNTVQQALWKFEHTRKPYCGFTDAQTQGYFILVE